MEIPLILALGVTFFLLYESHNRNKELESVAESYRYENKLEAIVYSKLLDEDKRQEISDKIRNYKEKACEELIKLGFAKNESLDLRTLVKAVELANNDRI